MDSLILPALFILFIWLCSLNNEVYKIKAALEQLNQNKTHRHPKKTVAAEQEKLPEAVIEKQLPPEPKIWPEPAASQNTAADFENLFLGNIFNKIGAIALIIGVAVFIKLVSPYFSMSPAMKIASGYILGLITLGLGKKLNRAETKNYANVLTGTGLGILFVSTWFASAYYHLFSAWTAVIISCGLISGSWFIAACSNSRTILIISLIAGYLNPFFTAGIRIPADFLFGYFIFINLLSIMFTLRRQSISMLNIFNLLFSSAIIGIYAIFTSKSISLIYPFLLWASYLLYDQIRLYRLSDSEENDNNIILGWFNMAVFVAFGRMILPEFSQQTGLFTASVAAVYLILSIITGHLKHKAFMPYIYSAIITSALSLHDLTSGIYTIAAWTAQALLLIILAQKLKLSRLITWSVPIIILAIVKIFLTPQATYYLSSGLYTPILNFRAGLYGIPFIGCLAAWLLLKNKQNEIAAFYKFSAISLAYLFFSFEINMSILKFLSYESVSYSHIRFTRNMTWGLIGFIYALQIFRFYKVSGLWLANAASTAAYYISLIYILLNGIHTPDLQAYIPLLNIRFIAFITGIVVSALWAHWQKKDFYLYIAVILGFIIINTEASEITGKLRLFSAKAATLTISWVLYAAGLIVAGILRKQKVLKIFGIWIALAAVAKVIFFDMASMAPVYKTAAFLCLGIILLIISYYYTKHKNSDIIKK